MRKRARFTGEAVPETGDRVPYIVRADVATAVKSKQLKANELSEAPLYTQSRGVPINTEYYIARQIWPSVIRIFTAIAEPIKSVIVSSNMKQSARESLIAHQRLFSKDLPHMTKIVAKKVNKLNVNWVTVVPKCLSCGGRMKSSDGGSACCSKCDDPKDPSRLTKVFQKYDAEYKKRKETHDKAWDTCRNCQGGG